MYCFTDYCWKTSGIYSDANACPLFTHIALQITKLCLPWKSHENLPQHQHSKLPYLKQVIALQCQVGAKNSLHHLLNFVMELEILN